MKFHWVSTTKNSTYDITTPKGRKQIVSFNKDDVLILGVPSYGGRIPNITVDYLKSLKGKLS